MIRGAALLAAALGGGFGIASAQTSISASHGIEHLSNGARDWRESTVLVRHGLRDDTPGAAATLALTRTERFGLRDSQAGVSLATPLAPKVFATIEASGSTTHRVLPESALGTALQYEFAKAWLVHGGVRTTRYDNARINQASLALEHYTGPFSWSIGGRRAHAFGTNAGSGELRGTYYHGERNSIGLIVAAGREATSIGSIVTLTSQRSVALTGRYWMHPRLALTYSAAHTREGDYYSRNGASLGLQVVL
ncbi:YaiO family outer membrane beta-barrel protein [Massilia sp. METH4]|uniref:YaiO family outer membrane beta-barrel protein n=1 Tax=Massilia sp. METH4 TaxID=3123041 RepID=UPI0030CF1CCD